jgi:hypothetical protein
MSAPQRRSGIIALIVSGTLLAAALLETGSAAAAAGAPSVRMVSSSTKVTLKRPPGRRAYLNLGVFAAAVGGSFEIWASRPDYDTPIGLWQVVRSNGTVVAKYPLPETSKTPSNGISRFFHVTVTDDAGRTILDRYHAFCPSAGELARVSDEGPAVATYPQFCGGNPFTLGQVWGIDEGWASNAFGYGSSDGINGPDGHYTATVSIASDYQSLFGVPSADASVSVSVTVKTQKRGYCIPYCEEDAHTVRGGRNHVARLGSRRNSVPVMTNPDPSIRPDLVALPAWGITVDHQRKGRRDYLDFGATVWDEGPSPMVVEGYRHTDGMPIMDGWEYFYSNGVAVGRAPAGDLMWDGRPGHQHWHFEQFARYSLLTADQTQIVRSEKTGFCLTPTDAIDMTLPGAEWNPYQVGLGTACGGRGSIWTREVLPTGWGDTYFQGLPGQSFDITDLPNGTYYIAVQANPDGALLEVSTANNTELRKVILGGKPGHRTVKVPPWHGIDTESGGSPTGGGGVPVPLPAMAARN